MHAQAMNHFGPNRGFGGQPQPQRQGGRRGNNRGGFRQTRFDNQPQQQQHQRNPNQGQRPNNEGQQPRPQQQQQPQQKPDQQQQQKPVQQQQQQQQKPVQQQQQQQQQKAPQPQQQQTAKPQQTPPKPQQQQQQPKPATPQQQPQQQQQNKPQQQQPPRNDNQKQTPVKNGVADTVDLTKEIQPLMQLDAKNPQGDNQKQHQNGGNFRGNRGGWQGGNQNRQDGQGNRPWQGSGQGQQNHQGGNQGGPRNQQQRNNRPQFGPDGKPLREEHLLASKLRDLAGPLVDLPPLDNSEVKFNGRARLYIGNLTNDVTEEEILNLFKCYGETSELFLNKEKNFGFIKMDYRVNAEKAKHELDGNVRNGRPLRVRFAPHNSAVRVKNLPSFVSNELLYRAFEIFGKIERAYVKVDERGRTVGEGVVEYARKPSALAAIRNCTEKCFFLTSSLRPVIVESYEEPDEADGFPEKNLPKKNQEFLRARESGPRFSEPGTFEHEYGTRWKSLHELYKQKEDALKKELVAEEEKLEAQMEFAKYEHETELLREQLRQREQDRERQKRTWEMAERAAEERRDAERQAQMRHGEHLEQRMRLQDDELRRRQQENTLFVQAQRLNSMLDRQEQGMFDSQPVPLEGGFRDNMGRGYDDMQQNRSAGGWEGPRAMDDFPNKRRRF